MTPTRALVLSGLVLALLVGGLLYALGDTPGGRAPAPAIASQGTSSTGAEVLRPEDLTAAAALAERDAGRAVASAVSFAAGSLDVRVVLPPDAPADPDLSVLLTTASELEGTWHQAWLIDARADGSGVLARAAVGADGRATLPLPEGIEEPRVVLDGRFLYLDRPVAPGAAESELRLDARLGACLRVDLEGELVASGDVSLLGGNLSGRGRGGWRRVEQDAGGRTELLFRALAPENMWTLTADLDAQYSEPRMGLELEAGVETTVALAVATGAKISGRVLDEAREPVAGVEVETVSAMPWMRGGGGSNATTGDDGRFELRGLAGGTTQLNASLEGWRDTKSEELEVAAGGELAGVELVLDRGAEITGIVRFADGRPAPGARVIAEARESRNWGGWGGSRLTRAGSTTTADDGTFGLSGLGSGAFGLRASLTVGEGEAAPRWRAAETGVAGGRADVVLTLAGPLAFTGMVTDDRGEPVDAFEVSVRSVEDGGPRDSQSYEGVAGQFTFARVGAGEYTVSAESDGHVQLAEYSVVLPAGDVPLALTLERTAAIRGRVLDLGGRPVADATVRVDDGRSSGGGGWFGPTGPSAETDEEGVFAFEELAPGTVELTASAEGWADGEALAFDLGPATVVEGAELSLRVGGTIRGTVLTPEGDPQAGRRVTWGANSMGFGSNDETESDANGRFLFEHVTPGTWSVSASPSMADIAERSRESGAQAGFMEAMGELITETVDVVDGKEVEVFLGGEPKQPVRVFGRVTRAGEPLADAQVVAVSEGSAVFEGMKTSTTSADGTYELIVDRPGPHVVSARVDASGIEELVEVPRSAEVRVDLAIPLGRIEGLVRAPGGEPAAGVRLSIQRQDGLGRVRWGGDQATTDELGEYAFLDLSAGVYTVRANVSSWSGRSEQRFGTEIRSDVELGDDQTRTGVDFELMAAGTVTGLVRGTDGEPVAEATVFFRDAAGRLVSSVSGTRTDAAGRFEEKGLAPGTYSLSARAEAATADDATAVEVRSGETSEATLTLGLGTTVLVTLEDPDGNAKRARVEILDGEGRDVGGLVTTDQLRAIFNGGSSPVETRLGPIPAGRYTVRATAADGTVVEKKTRLRGRGDEKKVKLKLDR